MPERQTDTKILSDLIDRLNAGDPSARARLIEHASGRLHQIIRNRLRNFPSLHRWEQTDDVFQSVMLRLWRALEECRPASVREFFALAGVQIRRQLIDLKRHLFGPDGPAKHHWTDGGSTDQPGVLEGAAAEDDTTPSRILQQRETFSHVDELVDTLPEDAREAIDLLWYEGLSYDDAASVLGVSSRTVRRRERDAQVLLSAALDRG